MKLRLSGCVALLATTAFSSLYAAPGDPLAPLRPGEGK
jgi:hypothetical protein